MRFERGIAVATSDKQNPRYEYITRWRKKKATDLFVFRSRVIPHHLNVNHGNDQIQSDMLLGEAQDI